MSVTTFAELKTSIAAWLNRSGATSFTDRAGDFVTFCEADFNSKLRVRAMEQYSNSAMTTATGVTTAALPTGWLQGRSVWLAGTTPKQILRYYTPDQLHTVYVQNSSGQPKVFSIVGDNAEFGPTPDAAYDVAALFYKKLDALSDTTTSNWMLANHPDVYLYGSLKHAMPFLRHDQRMPVWESLYERALERVQRADDRDRHSGGTLTMQTDTGAP